MATWNHVETNRPQSDLVSTVANNCTFDSTIPTSLLPGPFYAEDFSEGDFIYATFGFVNPGSLSPSWDDYDYGILGTARAGIGFFYFYAPVPPYSADEASTGDDGCFEADFQKVHFWDYISTFWNHLDTPSRNMVENMWFGMVMAGGALTKKASRFLAAVAPTTTNVCVFEDYYDLQVGPMFARPVFLDPTEKSPKTIINPIGTILTEPEYDGFDPTFYDLIEITGDDYHKIRNLGDRPVSKITSECYVIVKPKNTDIETKYFSVTDFYSSEEATDCPASGEINNTLLTDEVVKSYTPAVTQVEIDAMGALKITGVDTTDISQYKVTISYSPGAAVVTWGATTLDITVDRTSLDQLGDIKIAVLTPVGTKWAEITNISPYGKVQTPLLVNVDVEDLYNYENAQVDGGRHYPTSGTVWKWFTGYPIGSEVPGTAEEGAWVDSKAKFKYVIEVKGSLAYLGAEAFSIYLTTGKSYNINKEVIDLPYLDSGIEIEGVYFKKNIDYTFVDYVVEFSEDIFVKRGVVDESCLYCKKTPIIENYLFEQHGGMVGIDDWTQYNYTNISGKAGLNTLQSALRSASSLAEYEKALNAYYGLPVAPDRARVIGLFETYGYKVTNVSGLTVTVEIRDGEELHPFVQGSGVMVDSAGDQYVISAVVPSLGKIKLNTVDNISYGDRLYVCLNNRFNIKNIYAETDTTPAYLDVYIREGNLPIKHVIDTVALISTVTDPVTGVAKITRYPEIIVHGTEDFDVDYNGLYHATDAYLHPSGEASLVRIELYRPDAGEDPVYNDYIGVDAVALNAGFAHFPWPTPKFLYMYMPGLDKLYRAYMDAPTDTIYDSGDSLAQYQVICRNASVLNGELFETWNQYRNFRKAPSINIGSNIIEMIFADPSSRFGQYFPARYVD